MRLIHAIWNSNSTLYLWGEESRDTPPDLSGNSNVLAHPFATSHDQLKIIAESMEFPIDSFDFINIQIPTYQSRPISKDIILSDNIEGDIKLRKWRIPVLALDPLASANFLTSISENKFPDGVRWGDSVLVWIEAVKLALEMLTKGRFLPISSRLNGAFHSFWQILPSLNDSDTRFRDLVAALPELCVVNHSETHGKNSSEVLLGFMSQIGNSLIRTFIKSLSLMAGVEISPHSRERWKAEIAWLNSLPEMTGAILEKPDDIYTLETNLIKWSNPLVHKSESHGIQTWMEIHAPEIFNSKINGDWILRFGLQLIGEENSRVIASTIWAGNQEIISSLGKSLEELEEKLLADLGKVCHFFPQLERCLNDTFPTSCILTTEEAYIFLKNSLPRLRDVGIDVEVPSWWQSPTSRVGLSFNVKPQQKVSASQPSMLGMSQLVNFNWQIAIGDSKFSTSDFAKLIETHGGLVPINNEWIEIDSVKAAATIQFLEKQETLPSISLLDAFKFGFGGVDQEQFLPITQFNTEGWLNTFLHEDNRKLELLPQPKGFSGALRHYQSEGYSWLLFLSDLGIGGCLADDMGLGKTIQFLALLLHEKERLAELDESRPNLLIVPMSILNNWIREATKFAPELRLHLHHGPSRLTGDSFRELANNCDLVITTYSLAFRDETSLSAVQWTRITLDEAQNIKNLSTKQTQAIRRIARAQMLNEVGRPCGRIALTGTPLENRLEELWSIFDFLNPGLLGNLTEFRREYALAIERFRNKDAGERLSRLVRPFILRRLKTDKNVIDDLPEKIEIEELITLTEEQASLYQSVLNNLLEHIDHTEGIHRKGMVLATITKLKQICNHPALYLKDRSPLSNRSGKLSRLQEILEELLAEGDRVLIFTQYAQMGALLQSYLESQFQMPVLFLHGSLSKQKRDELVYQFQEKKQHQIFILSLMAGGFGLNLTAANQVIHFDQWWNPAVEEQATDRAYRIGQKQTVQVRKLICSGTLEQTISDLLVHKKDLADRIVGNTKNMITQLSTDELKELLQLRTKTLWNPEDADV